MASETPTKPEVFVWTTPPNKRTCQRFEQRRAPRFLHHETQEACERWVRERRCSPGRLYDGCNWITCNANGTGAQSTLLGCAVGVEPVVEFERGKATLTAAAQNTLLSLVPLFARYIARDRKVVLVGSVLRNEASSSLARGHLEAAREQAVRAFLVSHGLSTNQLALSSEGHAARSKREDAAIVSFEFDPDYPLPPEPADTPNR